MFLSFCKNMNFISDSKMVLMTMIARVFDGLPLAASVQEDEQTGK